MKIITCPKCKKSYEEDGNETCVILNKETISCVFCGYYWQENK